MERGREAGGGEEEERTGEEGVTERVVAAKGEKKARGKESLAGRDTAESDGKRSGQEGAVWRGRRQMRCKGEDGIDGVKKC